MKTTLKFGKQRRPQKTGNEPDDDFDGPYDLDTEYDDYGNEFEALRSRPAISRRLTARRAIELAREELALKREIEDYPEH